MTLTPILSHHPLTFQEMMCTRADPSGPGQEAPFSHRTARPARWLLLPGVLDLSLLPHPPVCPDHRLGTDPQWAVGPHDLTACLADTWPREAPRGSSPSAQSRVPAQAASAAGWGVGGGRDPPTRAATWGKGRGPGGAQQVQQLQQRILDRGGPGAQGPRGADALPAHPLVHIPSRGGSAPRKLTVGGLGPDPSPKGAVLP